MKKIKVIIKEPGQKPRCVWVSNSLQNLQKIVGGYIQTVTIAENAVIICNEEGRLLGLPFNCRLCGVDFVGPIILAGVEGDEFDDFPLDYQNAKMAFPQLWEV